MVMGGVCSTLCGGEESTEVLFLLQKNKNPEKNNNNKNQTRTPH